MRWTERNIPDLTGQTWLVTGATAGLGLAAARSASRHGARILLGVRNPERGAEIARELGNAEVVDLDLSSLQNVRSAAAHVGGIDVLVNNAGASPERRELSPDGFELTLAVNFLGPFLLTNLLLPLVTRRVVVVSSTAHWTSHMDLEDPNCERRRWRKLPAYGQSKLAGMLWGAELARRLAAHGGAVDAQLAHPGWAATSVGNPLRAGMGRRALDPIMGTLAGKPEIAALTTVCAATQELLPGSYVGPGGPGEFRGYPRLARRSRAAADPELARRVWELAAEATRSDWPA